MTSGRSRDNEVEHAERMQASRKADERASGVARPGNSGAELAIRWRRMEWHERGVDTGAQTTFQQRLLNASRAAQAQARPAHERAMMITKAVNDKLSA